MTMKKQYNFSKAKRGPVVKTTRKEKITIRLDTKIVKWFKKQVHQENGGHYQQRINEALKHYIQERQEPLEGTLRRVIREELKQAAG